MVKANTHEPTIAEQLLAIQDDAEQQLLSELQDEGLEFDEENVIREFRQKAIPQRRAVHRKIASLNPAIEIEEMWVAFWRHQAPMLAQQAAYEPRARAAAAREEVYRAMKAWREQYTHNQARTERARALAAAQQPNHGIVKTIKETILPDGRVRVERVMPDLMNMIRNGQVAPEDTNNWEAAD